VDCQEHLAAVQTAAEVLAVAARMARLPSRHCLVGKSRCCWETQRSGFVGGRAERQGRFEGIGVEVVEEVLAVVAEAVVVGMLVRSRAAFASGVAASAPVVDDHPFAQEDTNAGYRLAIRSHLWTALAGYRC